MTLANGCVAHWTFDEGAGATAADLVGGYTGTLVNMEDPADWEAGVINTCIGPDGVDEYVSTFDAQTLLRDSFSLSCWAYSADWSAGEGYLTGYRRQDVPLNNYRANLEVFGNTIYFDCECTLDAIDRQLSANVLVDGEWAFVVGTANAVTGVQRLYFNGNVVASNATSVLGGMVSFDTNGLAMPIGAVQGDAVPHTFFSGLIDNVMLFDRPLSPEEVHVLYNAGHGTQIVADIDQPRAHSRRSLGSRSARRARHEER